MKNLNFYGLDSSNNRQLRMAIDTSGNIGLGIADPTTRLEIVGDLSLNGSIYHNGILFTPSETASTNIDQTTDISLNNLKIHGDLSANDASFNNIDTNNITVTSTIKTTQLDASSVIVDGTIKTTQLDASSVIVDGATKTTQLDASSVIVDG